MYNKDNILNNNETARVTMHRKGAHPDLPGTWTILQTGSSIYKNAYLYVYKVVDYGDKETLVNSIDRADGVMEWHVSFTQPAPEIVLTPPSV